LSSSLPYLSETERKTSNTIHIKFNFANQLNTTRYPPQDTMASINNEARIDLTPFDLARENDGTSGHQHPPAVES
jgi:hypothetical protein